MTKPKTYTQTSTCKECGKEFIIRRPWQKFDHPNCRMLWFMKKRVEERKAEERARLETEKVKKERLEARQAEAPQPNV